MPTALLRMRRRKPTREQSRILPSLRVMEDDLIADGVCIMSPSKTNVTTTIWVSISLFSRPFPFRLTCCQTPMIRVEIEINLCKVKRKEKKRI